MREALQIEKVFVLASTNIYTYFIYQVFRRKDFSLLVSVRLARYQSTYIMIPISMRYKDFKFIMMIPVTI